MPGSDGGRFPRDVRWPARLATALADEAEVIAEGLNGRTARIESPVAEGRNACRSSCRACARTRRSTCSSSTSARTTRTGSTRSWSPGRSGQSRNDSLAPRSMSATTRRAFSARRRRRIALWPRPSAELGRTLMQPLAGAAFALDGILIGAGPVVPQVVDDRSDRTLHHACVGGSRSRLGHRRRLDRLDVLTQCGSACSRSASAAGRGPSSAGPDIEVRVSALRQPQPGRS